MDEHSPDENQKTAATTVLTRRGSKEYALKIDADDLAERLGWTALHQAAALTEEGRQLTEALLESEFTYINSKDALGRTPLHWLAENGDTEAIQLLTQDPWRADVHTRDITGFTALHCACWADSFDSAAALLDAGGNADAKDKHERTPMMHFDSHQLLDLMIEKGANVYTSDDEGANIMHHVSIADQGALARILLERYGHNLCVQNHNGDGPLGLAIQNNSLEVLAVLLPLLRTFPVSDLSCLIYRDVCPKSLGKKPCEDVGATILISYCIWHTRLKPSTIVFAPQLTFDFLYKGISRLTRCAIRLRNLR